MNANFLEHGQVDRPIDGAANYLGKNVSPLDWRLKIVVEGDVGDDRCTVIDDENRRFGPANDGPEVAFAGQWQALVIYEQSYRRKSQVSRRKPLSTRLLRSIGLD